jgi:hypothetical protein
LCDTAGNEVSVLPIFLNQGSTFFVCVEAEDNAQAHVVSIEDMSLISADDSVTQVVYNSGTLQRLARGSCSGGKCIMEVLRRADFFGALSPGITTAIDGTGVAIMQLGSLGGGDSGDTRRRALTEEKSEFNGSFSAVAMESSSGAACVGSSVMVVGAVMIAGIFL